MIHHFLINPAAGKGDRTDATIRRITHVCNTRGATYHIYTTTRRGDATDYVRRTVTEQSEETHRFYACGGDGTLSEAVNGAVACKNAEFAVIPIGTGNDFVRNFTSPDFFTDIERQMDGECESLDLLFCNGRYSVNMVNIGFDSNAANRMQQFKRSPLIPSGFAYPFGVALTLCGRITTDMQIEFAGGEVISEPMLLCTAANGRFCGGGFHSNPRARLNDGLLDICAVRRISRTRFIKMVKYYKNGTHLDNEALRPILAYRQTSAVRLTFQKPINVSIDGEIEMNDTVDIRILPGALRFSVPRGSRLLAEGEAAETACATV